MSKRTIHVEITAVGQPRPYAPHEYAANITVTGFPLLEDRMRDVVRGTVHWFTDELEDGSMASHFRPRLKTLELREDIGTGEARAQTWFARVTEPYCD